MEKQAMKTHIEVNRDKLGGKPTVGPSRFSVAQLIAELADGERNLKELCDDFRLNYNAARGALQQVACMFDRKFSEGENEGVITVFQGYLQRHLHDL